MPSAEWKNVTVFISSTFNDMHAERDYLVKYVFPDLMCTSSMKWNIWVSSIKPIEIFVIPVTKQNREILLCKPVQPVFFLLRFPVVQADFVFEGTVRVVIPAVIIPDSTEIAADDHVVIARHSILLRKVLFVEAPTESVH